MKKTKPTKSELPSRKKRVNRHDLEYATTESLKHLETALYNLEQVKEAIADASWETKRLEGKIYVSTGERDLIESAEEFLLKRGMSGRLRLRLCVDLVTDSEIKPIAEARGEDLKYCFDILFKHLSRAPIQNEKIPLGP